MTPTILIVDDEDDLREAIAFDFRRRKFNVFTAASGRAALKIVETEKIDIVVSDVRMPDGDGVELLDKIKERNALLPVVIFITGFADISLEEAYDKGADAVFAKPFDRQALFATVQRAIQPRELRFQRKASRVEIELSVGLKFRKSGFSVQTKVQNLGRGGMFVTMEGRFPELLETADFRMETLSQPKIEVAGTGIVRWNRPVAVEQFPAGCGIEFQDLEHESLCQVVDLINFLKTKAYIPRR